jgi:exodeoxyribonuclease VII small subunit
MAQAKKDKDYQQMADELDGLIAWFEGDEVNLDESLVKYEQAMKLLNDMEAYLKTAENKIKKINAKFDGE